MGSLVVGGKAGLITADGGPAAQQERRRNRVPAVAGWRRVPRLRRTRPAPSPEGGLAAGRQAAGNRAGTGLRLLGRGLRGWSSLREFRLAAGAETPRACARRYLARNERGVTVARPAAQQRNPGKRCRNAC